jgi:hypothetical protein
MCELFVDRPPLIGGNLEDLAFVLEQDHRRDGLCGFRTSAVGRNHGGRGSIRHSHFIFQKMVAGHLLGIAAEKNVGAAAGHVGSDRDGTLAARLGDNARFAFVLLGVEHLVRDACFFQDVGDSFGFFDRDGADQHRLAAFVEMADAVRVGIVFLHDAVDHGLELFFFGAVDDVGIFLANQIAVRGNHDYIKVVDFRKLCGFGFCSAGHAGKLLVHAEIVLEGDGGEGLVFALDLDVLFGFDGLVQSVGPAAAGHLAARKLVDDDDFTVFHDVINVPLVQGMRAERLVHVMDHFHMSGVVQIAEA